MVVAVVLFTGSNRTGPVDSVKVLDLLLHLGERLSRSTEQ